MKIVRKTVRTAGAFLLAAAIVAAGTLPCFAAEETLQKPIGTLGSFDYIPNASYNEYLAAHTGEPDATEACEISVKEMKLDLQDDVLDGAASSESAPAEAVTLFENSTASWQFTVPQTGAYNIELDFRVLPGETTAVKFALGLDGIYPFSETESISLTRVWEDSKDIQHDTQGNEIKPSASEVNAWQTILLSDTSGFTKGPFRFYLTEGEHTLSIETFQNDVEISAIRFVAPENLPSYTDRLNEWAAKGYHAVNETVTVQGEALSAKSDKSITVASDHASPMTYPNDTFNILYNCVGGTNWQAAGQWIDWDVDVPQDGLYTIVLRYKQSAKVNDISSRTLYIDGEIPFAEARDLTFDYASGWQVKALGKNDEVYQFYLSKGTHTLRLEAALGEYNTVLYEVSAKLAELNEIYRKILMITGSSPDTNRDYEFKILIPDVLEEIHLVSEDLKNIEREIEAITSGGGQSTAVFKRLYTQMDEMYDDPNTIAKRFSTFKSNITSLGTWINDGRAQPLIIDYITLSSAEKELPAAEKNFFQVIGYYISQFFASFMMDYSSVGNLKSEDAAEEVTVWIATGRDQADIIRQMTNDTFTPNSGISANIQLVNGGALMPATLAGIGPDVYLGMDETSPVNYALRGAVCDMSKMDGIDEVVSRFYDCALLPFRLDGGIYAIPETMVYPMMFYRKDILTDLGIKQEDLTTWNNLLQKVLPELDMNYFDFGLTTGLKSYAMFLYQNNGDFYNKEHTASALDTQEALTAFQMMTSLYTDYGLDLAFDFSNRFRSGEMPLAITDFSAYNQMSVFAPEIDGLWSMIPVPGIEDADGNIKHISVCTVTGAVILAKSENTHAAWEFIKWWTEAETQSRYGTDLETVMGTGARYASANIEAMKNVQWDKTVADALQSQLQNVVGMPQIAGSYFTTRHYDFAFRDVVYNSLNARECLADASENITREIEDKRAEFYND